MRGGAVADYGKRSLDAGRFIKGESLLNRRRFGGGKVADFAFPEGRRITGSALQSDGRSFGSGSLEKLYQIFMLWSTVLFNLLLIFLKKTK